MADPKQIAAALKFHESNQGFGLLSDENDMKRINDIMRMQNPQSGESYLQSDNGIPITAMGGLAKVPHGLAGGGRIGTEIPLTEEQNLILGLTGNFIHSPQAKRINPTGLDFMFNSPNSSFGVQYNQPNKNMMQPTSYENLNQSAIPTFLMNYKRQF
jgi:hypothetical protein